MTTPAGKDNAPTPPATVRLGRLAVAAAAAGRPLVLRFRDYPGPVLADLWRHFAGQVGTDRLVDLNRSGGLKELAKEPSKHLLVLAFDPRRCGEAAWAIRSAPSPSSQSASFRPSVFARFAEGDAEDDPGATLVLHGDDDEVEAVADYLRRAARDESFERRIATPASVGLDEALDDQIAQALRRHGDREVVRGLLAGECLLSAADDDAPKTVAAQHYRDVYESLQARVVRLADDPFDPLAVAMIERANTYLQPPSGPTANLKAARRDEEGRQTGVAADGIPRKITRRELVDLGDTKGRTVRGLLDRLLKDADGFARFRKLGLLRELPSDGWPPTDPKDLAKVLLAWSYRQVRDHFQPLVSAGLITADRKSGNGPWTYSVPEALARLGAGFGRLPSPAEVEATLARRVNPGHRSSTAVICLPPAPAKGQAELGKSEGLASTANPIAHVSDDLSGGQP